MLYFKVMKIFLFYGYVGDVYVYMGVVLEGIWMYVFVEWNINVDKCKMVWVVDNIWSIMLVFLIC